MATHRIASTPETIRWGMFDAGFPPLITVNSGDTVVLECVSGGPEVMPPPGSALTVPPLWRRSTRPSRRVGRGTS